MFVRIDLYISKSMNNDVANFKNVLLFLRLKPWMNAIGTWNSQATDSISKVSIVDETYPVKANFLPIHHVDIDSVITAHQ